jgi:hypothetical protein
MNAILEVAIGLLFVFLLFSLLVSAVNEAIFGHLTRLRARVLEDSLHALLSRRAKGFSVWAWIRRGFKAPPESGPGVFSEKLLKHPLVQGLVVGKHRCPNYLPAETFVDAALGTLLGLGTSTPNAPGAPVMIQAGISELASAVQNLSDDYARKVLSSVLAGAANLDEAKQKLEIWFNNSMERVSGVYKTYSQFWLYVWATILVLWLNIDTIEITHRLLTDAQFRSALSSGAVNFVEQNKGSSPRGSNQPPATVEPAGNNSAATVQTNSGVRAMTPGQILQEISKLNLPLGWGACTNAVSANSLIGWVIMKLPRLEIDFGDGSSKSGDYSLASGILTAGAPCPDTPQAWRLKLLGLVITIAAISQGAPFWFDLLNRITNLRGAGRPPAARTESN